MKVREAGGIAAAVVAVVGIPVLVAQVNQPQAAAPPAEAALSAAMTSEEKQGTDEGFLRVLTKGPPPKGSFRLLNPEGKDLVMTTRTRKSRCEDLPLRRTPVRGGGSEWCLNLRGIRDADEVAGTIFGKETKLSLTVSRRSGFMGWPALAVLLSLLVGIAVPVIPILLSRRIRKGLVDKEVARNEKKPRGQAIAGLAGWVEQRRRLHQKDEEILDLVDWVINTGPSIAERSRQELKRALEQSSLPGNHPYRRGAKGFLDESAELKASDFLKEGKREETYRGDKWVEGLSKLEKHRVELAELELDEDDGDADAEKALQEARRAIEAADRPEALTDIDGKLMAVQRLTPVKRTVLDLETLEGEDWSHVMFARNIVAPGAFRIRPHVEEPHPAPLATIEPEPVGRRPNPDRLSLYRVCTGALVLFVIGLAILVVKQEIYQPVADFGDFGDYFALVSASIAAGASSSVVALLAPWYPSEALSEG